MLIVFLFIRNRKREDVSGQDILNGKESIRNNRLEHNNLSVINDHRKNNHNKQSIHSLNTEVPNLKFFKNEE